MVHEKLVTYVMKNSLMEEKDTEGAYLSEPRMYIHSTGDFAIVANNHSHSMLLVPTMVSE